MAVESVYSMDGDVAPLAAICDAAAEFGAAVRWVLFCDVTRSRLVGWLVCRFNVTRVHTTTLCVQVIVDEAHSTGVLGPGGRGLVAQEALEDHPALLCSIHTFGKALGCHGALLCGPAVLKEYCANYCAPFIYSTAASFHRCVRAWGAPVARHAILPHPIHQNLTPPPHPLKKQNQNHTKPKPSLAAMRVACEFQAQQGDPRRQHLDALVRSFRSHLGQEDAALQRALLPSPTPIQAVLVPGNARCARVAAALQARGMDVRPLRPPTVPAGKERLRVVLHAHNTAEEVAGLARELRVALALHANENDDHQDDGDGARDAAARVAPPRRAGQPPQQPVAAAPATAAAAVAGGGGAGGMSRL